MGRPKKLVETANVETKAPETVEKVTNSTDSCVVTWESNGEKFEQTYTVAEHGKYFRDVAQTWADRVNGKVK